MRKIRIKSGFTLIELLVVIAIIALLMSVMMPALNKAKLQARKVVCQSQDRQICLAMITYGVEHQDWLPIGNWADGDAGVDAKMFATNVLKSIDVLACPNDNTNKGVPDTHNLMDTLDIWREDKTRSYTYNVGGGAYQWGLWKTSVVKSPSEKILISEAHNESNYAYGPYFSGYWGPILQTAKFDLSSYWYWKPYVRYKRMIDIDDYVYAHEDGANFGYVDGSVGFIENCDYDKTKPADEQTPSLRSFTPDGGDAWYPDR